MRLLVTGGAGYIGSVVADHLLRAGHSVTVLDNLSKGHREAVPAQAEFNLADTGDQPALARIFEQGRFDAVMHFAASSRRASRCFARRSFSTTIAPAR